MNHPTYRIALTTAFVTPVVEHWVEREIAQRVHPMKDRSDDPSLPRANMADVGFPREKKIKTFYDPHRISEATLNPDVFVWNFNVC